MSICYNLRTQKERVLRGLQMSSEKEKGKCPYYCVWIMSGNDKCKLPDEDSDPNLLDQFLELLQKKKKEMNED